MRAPHAVIHSRLARYGGRALILTGILVVLGLAGDAVSLQTRRDPRMRTIPHTSEPILPRLQPDDEVVVVEREQEEVAVAGTPSVKDLIAHAVNHSDVIAVIRITDVQGVLVEDQTWINTQVLGTIDELIMSRELAVSPGQYVEIHGSGGEMRLGGVRVIAGQRLMVQRNHQYLVFLYLNKEANFLYPSTRRLPSIRVAHCRTHGARGTPMRCVTSFTV